MALDAFEVFPEEVWLMIINEVKDPQTWLNLSRTCSSLQRVMEPRKLFALLPAVLVPVSKYLGFEEMLESRFVCRSWKAAVDYVAELELVKKPSPIRLLDCTFGTMKFSSSTKILRFLEDMGSHTGNPFIGRSIRLTFGSYRIYVYEDEELFWNSAQKLIERFGQHIENITLTSEWESDQNASQKAILFITLLKSMPGLKTIKLQMDEESKFFGEVIYNADWNNNQPVFKHLEIIRLKRMSNSISTGLLRALHKMCFHADKVNHLGGIYEISSNLCTMFPNVETVEGMFENNILDDLKETNWPLKSFSNDEDGRYWDFHDAFGVFEGFGHTLRTLVLPNYMTVKKSLLESVQLPFLKLLKLGQINCNTLDFLLEFDSLDEMKVESIEFNRARTNSVMEYVDEQIIIGTISESLHTEAKVLPFLSKYLKKKDFVQLRLVSRAWKDAVDKLAECEQELRLEGNFIFEKTYNFQTKREIQKFLSKMNTNCENPFVGRSVHLSRSFLSINRNSEEFWSSVFKLVERFGSHMYKLTLTNFCDIKSEKDCLKICHGLVNLLKLTPNLKSLDIEGATGASYTDDLYKKVANSTDHLENIVPALLQLETLRVQGCFEGFSEKYLFGIIHKMCCYPEKLTKLLVHFRYSSELSSKFPNVQIFEGYFREEDGASLKSSGWRLKSLTDDGYPELKLENVYPFIHHFQETLTSLSLPNGVLFEGTGCMEMPYLNTLKLDSVKSRSLKIFSRLTKLKKLSVHTFHFKRQGKF